MKNRKIHPYEEQKKEKQMKALAVFAGIIGTIALVLALDYGGFLWESFMKPKRENMRRQVFEQTKSFREGKRQELIRYKYQYDTQEENRSIIASTVRMQFADVDADELEPQLKQFINQCFGN